jgi:hypothetical protein
MILLVALIALMTLWGCSSSMDSAGDKSEIDERYETVGIDVCVQCHDIKGQEWLFSRQGNAEPEGSPRSPHRPGESSCAECHNPLNDGDLIEFAFNTQEKRRDVIGCESCHGGGSRHYGLGPIEYPKPGPEICGPCHNRDDNHADTDQLIYDKWAASRHAESLHGEDRNPCQRCHTNEGALASNVAGYTGDKDVLGTSDDLGRRAPLAFPEEVVTAVSCATCHDVHKAGELRQVWSSDGDNDYLWDPNENGSNNDQFDLCTSCHVLYNDEGTLVGSGSEASGTAPFYHDTDWYQIIGTTHYDQPTDTDRCNSRAASKIEGYNIRWQNENACFDCHGHEFRTATRPYPEGDDRDDPTIWTEWSSSAHAGYLFTEKLAAASEQAGGGDPADAPRSTDTVDAVMFAGAEGAVGEGWNYYNWDHPERASCQRCHTATGLVNFLDADINDEEYDQDNNDFSHLVMWNQDDDGCGSAQNEMLYCWGCHTNAPDGELRNPGELTLDFVYLDADEAEGEPEFVVLPDKGNSNVCGSCHSGRGNDTSIRQSVIDDNRSSRFAGHHAPTAGSLYAEVVHTGFEFTGQNYAPVPFFVHDDIETNGEESPETGDGPCVGCHMANTANHTFEAVEKDTNGNIVEITNQILCNNCHGAIVMNPSVLNELKAGFEDASELLDAYVTNDITNYLGLDIRANYETVPLNAYGAFQDSIYMQEESGIYVHNRIYGKRLIFDSIDWLDNGVLNGTITIPADYPEARIWLNAGSNGIATRP